MYLTVVIITIVVFNQGLIDLFDNPIEKSEVFIGDTLAMATDSLDPAPSIQGFSLDTLILATDSLHRILEHMPDTTMPPLKEKKEQAVFRSCALQNMRIEVDINKRMLYVFSGDEEVAMYPVAVGKPEWPTRTGSWRIYEVVWNPWWHPPDEEWAWYRAIMAPGDPDNPLGRAQLIYDAPRSIHGTIEPSSIGRAVSHGSIRVTNETAMLLARKVMESAGIVYDEQWYEEVARDRSKNVRIPLSQRIPIEVHRGR